ncbi:7,8-dihydro-8-oxoguanine triphosphatase-like [Oopsacas minuta]|uniref:Oxidized purine nucleoside triphosphate hydrolase n=1 Tax=Oopsacas minuta TaxID=111878 RepID=A0AAV7JR28_9METZ|nr:7,8-dihydro-8-oxoguanine triphosphatase-like [Oopsacas minuta]
MPLILTLVFVLREGQVLLGLKKRGFGQGLWNGFGGKVNLADGETIIQGAVRELQEESGLIGNNLEKVAILNFQFEKDMGKYTDLEIHVFKTSTFEGEIIESEEMLPKWYNISDIPYKEMWPDDAIWYPVMFAGKLFTADIKFSDEKTMISHKITEVLSFE